ncbi:MAG: DUF3570 domain-containing protein [Myxococcota bacterium]|nr:DUF3570 domain-containing protein [Myxococcota bacterium]MDW8363968.1 DUF3570 domain-containing protein [Myxococcales bacterium]
MTGAALSRAALLVLGIGWVLAHPESASAQVRLRTTGTVFHEAGGPLEMTVLVPAADLEAEIAEVVVLRAGWQADVVSGASVAVVDAPATSVDAIASATRLDDVRHTVGGGLELRSEYASVGAGYSWGRESDYRSHGLTVTGRAELFDRNTGLEIAIGRGFDRACNLHQPRAREPVERQRMPSSDGCFASAERESLPLDLMTVQGGWTQAWSPVLATQLVVGGQLLHGYQGNPYRAVWLGRSAAQEYHPLDRARRYVALGTRFWVAPVEGAVQLWARGYDDSWGVRALSAEIAWDQSLGEALRLRLRGRYHAQTGALFYSDDYARQQRGRYFTGDRELSPMSSLLVGARLVWSPSPDDEGRVLGLLDRFAVVLKGDWVSHRFDEFRYGRAAVPNGDALVATVGLEVEP